jgi:uncharacterized protein YihD (DUF1040 family)
MAVVYLDESLLLNEKDIYYNKDKFDSGEINLCFITGLSGSGKSTMSREMAKQKKIEHVGLDWIGCCKDHFTLLELKDRSMMAYSYFTGPGKRFFRTKKELIDILSQNAEKNGINCYYFTLYREFITFALKYSSSHKDKKYIIEGVQLYYPDDGNGSLFKPSEFDNCAFYIKGTSVLISKIRAAKRDSRYGFIKGKEVEEVFDTKTRIKNFIKLMSSNWKYTLIQENKIKEFRNYFKNKMKENKE